MALRRIESRRSLAMKAPKARRMPPTKDSVEGWSNRKPVSPSVMVSARPPVERPIGSEPKRCAYIWLNPQGSKRDGISVKSLPAKMRRAWGAGGAIDQPLLKLRPARARHHDLPAGLDDLVRRGKHEVNALLVHEPRDEAEDRAARHGKAELLADIV